MSNQLKKTQLPNGNMFRLTKLKVFLVPCLGWPLLQKKKKKLHFHRQNAAPHRQSDSVLAWVLQQRRSELILDKFMGGKSIFDYRKQGRALKHGSKGASNTKNKSRKKFCENK